MTTREIWEGESGGGIDLGQLSVSSQFYCDQVESFSQCLPGGESCVSGRRLLKACLRLRGEAGIHSRTGGTQRSGRCFCAADSSPAEAVTEEKIKFVALLDGGLIKLVEEKPAQEEPDLLQIAL